MQFVSLCAPLNPCVASKAEGRRGPTWIIASEDVSKIALGFRRSAIESHRARLDGSNLNSKHIGINEMIGSIKLPFYIQWLSTDHSSQDGKAVAAIEKITIAAT